ncbi:hypothetical protein I7I51_08881 [Histoplasma capsulatum]|uniref:Uncharacterized protein n=1 Tax=Ajellomyces capsulatus TaxID=5037 RepID=A0A8A1LZ24_AJECA|nr:hypothetical protein I7I51_08881 [Histoplasma capsulatum]
MFTKLLFSDFPKKKIISVTAFFHGNETEYSFWPARRMRGNHAQAPASLRYARLRPPAEETDKYKYRVSESLRNQAREPSSGRRNVARFGLVQHGASWWKKGRSDLQHP